MHLVQTVNGGFLINPAWVLPDAGVVIATDDGIRCLMRAGKVAKAEEAGRRMRVMAKHMGLVKIGLTELRLENTTVPGVGFCKAWTADVSLSGPVPNNEFLQCAGDCPNPSLDSEFTAFELEFDVSTVLDVFRGQPMSTLLIKFLAPDCNPYGVTLESTREILKVRIAEQIKGFGRYKSPESWAVKTGIQKVKLASRSVVHARVY